MLTTKVKFGIGTLFACLSVLLLSLVSPKASALYHRGDFDDENPLDIITIAQNTYDEYWNTSLNWDNFQHSFLTKNADNGYYYYYFGNWNNIDGVPRIYANMPIGNDRVNINGDIGYIKFDLDGNYLSGMVFATGSSTYLYGWQETYYFSVSTTIQFNNGSWAYTSEDEYVTQFSDYLYILPKQLSGFEVYACVTDTSYKSGWWSSTNKYILKVTGTYNGQPFTITYPNYPAYFMTTRIEEYQWNVVDNEYVNILIPDPYSTPSPFIQNIAYVADITVDSISSPELNYSSSWTHTGYENAMSVGLNSLLNASKEYLNDDSLTDDFLWQVWTVSLVGYSDNRTYYSTILDYSVVDEGTVPDPDPTDIDWYSSLDQILQTINNNQMYNYLNTPPIGYKKVGYVGQFGTLTTVTDPNFEFQPIENLDTDAMGFFSWLVNLIVDSPVGILMLFALTFLVVSAVIK